jgi:hypothetical protein
MRGYAGGESAHPRRHAAGLCFNPVRGAIPDRESTGLTRSAPTNQAAPSRMDGPGPGESPLLLQILSNGWASVLMALPETHCPLKDDVKTSFGPRRLGVGRGHSDTLSDPDMAGGSPATSMGPDL